METKVGRIDLIIGCMYAGKSSELIRLVNRFKTINKTILVINHVDNNRYTSPSTISTHDKVECECISINTLSSIKQNSQLRKLYYEADIIIIEELQFFTDAFVFMTEAADIDKKNVIGVGLDGDYNRAPFGDIHRIIPHADTITKLTALCKICGDGTPAIFSKRICNYTEIRLVGGEESYIAVCREHFLKN